jgi:hypothetical protein
MQTVDRLSASAGAQEGRLRLVLINLAFAQLTLGVVLAVAPGFFFDTIADYGTQNDHYLRDISTFYLAFGVVLLAALERISWRVPLLAFGALQYGLHTLNHLLDIGEADPGWLGPFNFISLLLLTAGFVYALRISARPG